MEAIRAVVSLRNMDVGTIHLVGYHERNHVDPLLP